MTPARQRHLWRFAVGYALRAFVLAALLPIWTAWYFSPWEATGEISWFPLMLHSFGRAAWEVQPRPNLVEFFGPELAKAVAVLFVGAVLGLVLAGRPVHVVRVARPSSPASTPDELDSGQPQPTAPAPGRSKAEGDR